jgi:hypothetical protein
VTVLLIGSGAVAVGITAVFIIKTIVTGVVPYDTGAANKANAPQSTDTEDAVLSRAKKMVI